MISRPASILMICNNSTMGRSLGRAIAAQGLPTPAWVVMREGGGSPRASSSDVVIVIEPEPAAGSEHASWLAMLAAGGPLIVVAESEPVGGADRIAPHDGWETRVVERLVEHLGLSAALLPTYENRLRVLGRELDLRGYAGVSIVETDAAFQVRPEAPGHEGLAGFEFTSRDFGRFVREALVARGEDPWVRPTGRLVAAGHEPLLRNLGRNLDRDGVTQVQIVSLARSLVVSGLRARSPYDAPEPFQAMLREAHLRDLERQTGYERRQPEGWIARFSKKMGLGS